MCVPADPAIPLLAAYPEEITRQVCIGGCTRMFITVKHLKPAKHLTMGGWFQKLGYSHEMESTAIK